ITSWNMAASSTSSRIQNWTPTWKSFTSIWGFENSGLNPGAVTRRRNANETSGEFGRACGRIGLRQCAGADDRQGRRDERYVEPLFRHRRRGLDRGRETGD